MTDEAYVLKQDTLEKKNTARGARARKCGAHSRRCTLPSDSLTPAQWKRRNGPVVTTKLNQPMTATEFKALSPANKRAYIEHLRSRFPLVSLRDIAEMLGCSRPSVRNWLEADGIDMTWPKNGGHWDKREWLAFCGRAQTQDQAEAYAETMPEVKAETPTAAAATITEGYVAMRGALSDILAALPAQLPAAMLTGEWNISIHFSAHNELV